MLDAHNYILRIVYEGTKRNLRIGSHAPILIGEVVELCLNHDNPLDQAQVYIASSYQPTHSDRVVLNGQVLGEPVKVCANDECQQCRDCIINHVCT